jgi:translocator protein
MDDLSMATPEALRPLTLGFWFLICLGVSTAGARWTLTETKGWYRGLVRPSFTPPDRIFPVVWTILYFMMAIAAWMIGEQAHSVWRSAGLILFIVQLGLNLTWSWIFFRRHAIGAALVEIVALWIGIGATTMVFSRVSSVAAWLMAPYWAWVSFAAVLNFAIWRLNR